MAAPRFSGERVTIHGLQSRADLNGRSGSLVTRIAATGRWKVRTDGDEVIAIKPECLSIDQSPPTCSVLWAGPTPPTDAQHRVRALHVVLGKVAYEANQAFVDGGGVAAVVQIAFGAWPEGGLANSQHWADEVVQVAPGVFQSARRVALSALADMAPEGEPYVSALVQNVLFREAFAPVAASLLSNYRWRQPFASMCCPHDHDQQQYMAERLVNIANCTLYNWAQLSEAANADAKTTSAVAALILPILQAIPSPIPDYARNSAAERKRAARALRVARANELDRLLGEPDNPEETLRKMRESGMPIPPGYEAAAKRLPIAAPKDSLERKSDYMADGVARMLYSVLFKAKNHPKPLDAPWMASVVASGAPAKLVDLYAPFADLMSDPKHASDPALVAIKFWTTCAGSGTGAAQATSQPLKAAKAPQPSGDVNSDGRGFDARAQLLGTCAECGANVRSLKWCAGCHIVGYCGAECQKAGWNAHKKLCLPHTKWAAFVKHVMAVQTEPFLAGPFAGRLPAEVFARGDGTPVYSKRQLSLQEYVMMLSSSEKKFSSASERQAATEGADGVSQHGAVTWVRAGVVAATYTHGPKLRLCDRPNCDSCLIAWRQTHEARLCQVCGKQLMEFRGIGQPMGPATTPVWLRKVHPDPQNAEPRLHFAELETCSERCKRTILENFGQRGDVSRNDFIDSADALAKSPTGDRAHFVTVEHDELTGTSLNDAARNLNLGGV